MAMRSPLVVACALFTFMLLAEPLRPYLSAFADDADSLVDIGSIQVGQCQEDKKVTQPDTQCAAPPGADCPSSSIQVTVNLGITGGVIVQINGGIQFQYTQHTGCSQNNALWRQGCASSTGIQWTNVASGQTASGDMKQCQNFKDNEVCKPVNVNTTITLPQTLIQALIAKYGGPNRNYTYTFAEVVCQGDSTTGNTNRCPGTNGGQTWWWAPRTTLCN